MTDMEQDDEFDEFDVPPEEIDRVIEEGEPVEFGGGVVIRLSTIPRVARTRALGHADQLDDPAAAAG